MLSYFLISSISLCLLYAVYWVFLRQETFFRLNRYYLLFVAVISLLIPFANLPEEIDTEIIEKQLFTLVLTLPTPQAVEAEIPAVVIDLKASETVSIKKQPTIYQILVSYFQENWQMILLCIYLIGVLWYVFQFLKGLKKIFALIQTHEKTKQGNYYLIQYEGNKGVFSFFHYLFWSKQIPDNEVIKKHELAHIHQKHSFDILFFELLTIVFWYNPVLRLYQKSIRLIHEYLADEAVTQSISSKTNYAHTLVAHATRGANLQLIHSFYHQQTLKQRIMKIYQEKSTTKARRKYLFALPVLVLCLFVSACQKQELLQKDNFTFEQRPQEIATYIPQDFQEKMKELRATYPNYYFEFRSKYAAFMKRDLDESAEGMSEDGKIMYYRAISVQEYTHYLVKNEEKHLAEMIKEHGAESIIVTARKESMKQLFVNNDYNNAPQIGYLYMQDGKRYSHWEDDEEAEDLTAYTEVDVYPSPRDGANFYEEMFKLISFEEYFKDIEASDLQGDMVLEAVVNKGGGLIKVNLIESIQVTIPREREQNVRNAMPSRLRYMTIENAVNGLLFQAFQGRSALRGWKAGVKNGKRVDTKIRFKIPLEMIKKAMSC